MVWSYLTIHVLSFVFLLLFQISFALPCVLFLLYMCFDKFLSYAAIHFTKWLRVHCITQMILDLYLDLQQTTLLTWIHSTSHYLPHPLDQPNFKISNLIGLVLDINDSFPLLRRLNVPSYPCYEDYRTLEELEKEWVAINFTSCWWSINFTWYFSPLRCETFVWEYLYFVWIFHFSLKLRKSFS